MKLLIILAFVLPVALHAEDAPKPTPCDEAILGKQACVEIKRISDRYDQIDQQISKLQQQLAESQAELAIYQRATFQCQANEIHAQAVSSAKQSVQRRPGVDPANGAVSKDNPTVEAKTK